MLVRTNIALIVLLLPIISFAQETPPPLSDDEEAPTPSFEIADPDDAALDSPVFNFPVQTAIEAGLDRHEVPLNRTAELKVEIRWQGRLDEVEFEKPEKPHLVGLMIESVSSATWRGIEDGQKVARRIYTYTLKPVSEGKATVGSISVDYTDKGDGKSHTLVTPELTLEVLPPEREPLDKQLLAIYAACAVAGLALIGGLAALFMRRRRRIRAEREALAAIKTPEDIAWDTWDEARKTRLTGDYQEFYTAISHILRAYLSDKYELESAKSLTEDLLKELEQKIRDPEILFKTQDILEECDRMKFAGGQPPAYEVDRMEREFVAFLKKLTNRQDQDTEKKSYRDELLPEDDE